MFENESLVEDMLNDLDDEIKDARNCLIEKLKNLSKDNPHINPESTYKYFVIGYDSFRKCSEIVTETIIEYSKYDEEEFKKNHEYSWEDVESFVEEIMEKNGLTMEQISVMWDSISTLSNIFMSQVREIIKNKKENLYEPPNTNS